MNEIKKWYILWSNSYRPIHLIECIVSMSEADIWIPKYMEIDKQGKKQFKAIYAGYYFVYGTLEQCMNIEIYLSCNKYHGLSFLKDDLHKPVSLSDEEIEQVKDVENNFDVTYKFKISEIINIGDKVLIEGGPLNFLKGIVLEVKKTLLKVTFSMFNREVSLWVPISKCKVCMD